MCSAIDSTILSDSSCNNLCNYLFPKYANSPLAKPLCKGILCSFPEAMSVEATFLKQICTKNPSFSACYLLPLATSPTCVQYCDQGVDWMKKNI